MMKAKLQAGDKTIVLIGLSHANLASLRKAGLEGHILIEGKTLGIGLDIMITAAETEWEMLAAVAEYIDADTKATIDPRLKS